MKKRFNDQVAILVTNVTGNMWFFWTSLLFILCLRIASPPNLSNFLLNVENDLQLLLLAANAVVSGKQLSALMHILKHIKKDVDVIEETIEVN
jgi:hypothetical protein